METNATSFVFLYTQAVCFLVMKLNVYIESTAYIRNLQALHQRATNTANAFEMQLYFLYHDQNLMETQLVLSFCKRNQFVFLR